MRLTCPNCDAQYEVPDEAIPTGGRDVQCSNCGNMWFHPHPDHLARRMVPGDTSPVMEITPATSPDDQPAAPTLPDTSPADTPPTTRDDNNESTAGPGEDDALPPRREIDPNVIAILRSEAEREVKLRAAEHDGSVAVFPTPAAQAGDAPSSAVAIAEPSKESAGTTRRDAFPHLEDADPEQTADQPANPEVDPEPAPRARNASGFARGFALVLIVATAFVVVYSYADRISETVPKAAPLLESYVANVNQARVWLDSTLNSYLPK
jgi:predicted Zn finger-like uncharacterized protein